VVVSPLENSPGYTPGSVLDVESFAAATIAGAGLAEALARGERLSVRRPSGRIERPPPGSPVELDEPGFHELRTGTSTHLWVPVSVAAAESDLTPLSRPQFVARIQRPADTLEKTASVDVPATDPYWAWMLAWLAAGLLLLEGLMAARMARSPMAETA
jgi:hypothetical protein